MADMKRTVKDSLFSYIFKEPEYTRKLYLSLHPEDADVKEEDIKLVTLANILTTGIYNDLGVLVRDKLILMLEAQSTFSVNLALRMLLYLAATYKEYVEEQKLDLYATKRVTVPRPELYVIYTGKQDVPDVLRLSDLYEGAGSVEAEVKVLRGDTGDKDDIVYQYVRFCQISDDQRRAYGPTPTAVEETIRQCLEEGILAPILASRQKEVSDIMVTLYDQEKVMEIHDYNTRMAGRREGREEGRQEGRREGREEGRQEGRREGREEGRQEGRREGREEGRQEGREEGRQEGRQEGREEGREEGISAMVNTLKSLKIDKGVVVQEIVKQFHLLPHDAETRVEQYWAQ